MFTIFAPTNNNTMPNTDHTAILLASMLNHTTVSIRYPKNTDTPITVQVKGVGIGEGEMWKVKFTTPPDLFGNAATQTLPVADFLAQLHNGIVQHLYEPLAVIVQTTNAANVQLVEASAVCPHCATTDNGRVVEHKQILHLEIKQ